MPGGEVSVDIAIQREAVLLDEAQRRHCGNELRE
jgi:hypothetical protein